MSHEDLLEKFPYDVYLRGTTTKSAFTDRHVPAHWMSLCQQSSYWLRKMPDSKDEKGVPILFMEGWSVDALRVMAYWAEFGTLPFSMTTPGELGSEVFALAKECGMENLRHAMADFVPIHNVSEAVAICDDIAPPHHCVKAHQFLEAKKLSVYLLMKKKLQSPILEKMFIGLLGEDKKRAVEEVFKRRRLCPLTDEEFVLAHRNDDMFHGSLHDVLMLFHFKDDAFMTDLRGWMGMHEYVSASTGKKCDCRNAVN